MNKLRVRILDWRLPRRFGDRPGRRRNPLVGFARMQFGSGMIVSEVAVHQVGSRTWAYLLVFDETVGKPKWQPMLDFGDHDARSSSSRQVLVTRREGYPDPLKEPAAP